VYIMRNYYIVS